MTGNPGHKLSRGQARLVVTMPPSPSRLGDALAADIASEYIALARTTDAFRHLANIARDRFTIMIPYVDAVGADWASELFSLTAASERLLVLRDTSQLTRCGDAGLRLKNLVTRLINYGGADLSLETFHAKIVLADGVAAYVGSANLLKRSKHFNLECGVLLEGPAVTGVKVLLDAVTSMIDLEG